MRTATILCCALAFLAALANVATAAPVRPARQPIVRTMRISGYDYVLPDWWDSVKVTGNEEISEPRYSPDPIENLDNFREYWEKQKQRTPREHLKIRALAWQNRKDLPVFLAHYHKEAKELTPAAWIYADLFGLADSQGHLKEWYQCYMAHNAADCFFWLKEYESAGKWHQRAAAFVGHKDEAIRYYAEASADMIKTCDRSAAIVRARQKK